MTEPPRVVIDPNVFVSAAITPVGTCAQLLDAVNDELLTVIMCPRLLDELRRVLRRPKLHRYVDPDEVDAFCQTVRARSDLQPDPLRAASLTRDPNDDYLVALAIDNSADAIVTGDLDLLEAELPIAVWSPRSALDLIVTTDGD